MFYAPRKTAALIDNGFRACETSKIHAPCSMLLSKTAALIDNGFGACKANKIHAPCSMFYAPSKTRYADRQWISSV